MTIEASDLEAIVAKVTEALTPKFAEIANSAATAQIKRLEKTLEKAPVVTAPVTPTVDPEVINKIKADPQLTMLQTQLEEMKKQYAGAEKARQEAESRRRDDAAYGALRAALTGVKPELQDTAAKLLFHVEKRVTFDENGEALFRMKREYAPGQFEDVELPLSSGVEHWSKSKEAAAFIPAPGGAVGQGRGGRAPAPGALPSGRSANGLPVYDKPATSDAEKVARAQERSAALEKLFGGKTDF